VPDILSIAESSMLSDVLRLDVISNNLANANTPGFKRELAVAEGFADLLTGSFDALVRSHPRLGSTAAARMSRVTDSRPGTVRYTGNPLDVAVEGDGFLTLEGPEGSVYTRRGSFSLDATGRLVTADGLVVMGTDGEIQLATTIPRIDAEGVIWEDDARAGQLQLVRLGPLDGLEKLGAGLYRGGSPEASGDAPPVQVRQGHLETSNVSVMHEMVLLIELMRHLEATQRVVQSYDDTIEQTLRTIGDL